MLVALLDEGVRYTAWAVVLVMSGMLHTACALRESRTESRVTYYAPVLSPLGDRVLYLKRNTTYCIALAFRTDNWVKR
jgi:hypothetical protein